MLSARYAKVAYIQMFALTTPFFVTLMARIFLKEPIPKAFFPCVTVSVIGALLLLVSDVTTFSFVSLSGTDVLGLILSLVTAFFLALYMICTKFATNHKAPASQALLLQSLCSILAAVVMAVILPTDWSQLAYASSYEWLIILGIGFIFYAGNMINVRVISKAGASFNSFFIGLRLLVAILTGWFILGEKIDQWWQWIGVATVLAATTAFLIVQEREKEKSKKKMLTMLAMDSLPPVRESEEAGSQEKRGALGEELAPLALFAADDAEDSEVDLEHAPNDGQFSLAEKGAQSEGEESTDRDNTRLSASDDAHRGTFLFGESSSRGYQHLAGADEDTM